MPRSGLAGAMTGTSAACRRSMTPLQLEPSINAPWTSTTVMGAAAVGVASVMADPFWVVTTDETTDEAAMAALAPANRPMADRRDRRSPVSDMTVGFNTAYLL